MDWAFFFCVVSSVLGGIIGWLAREFCVSKEIKKALLRERASVLREKIIYKLLKAEDWGIQQLEIFQGEIRGRLEEEIDSDSIISQYTTRCADERPPKEHSGTAHDLIRVSAILRKLDFTPKLPTQDLETLEAVYATIADDY